MTEMREEGGGRRQVRINTRSRERGSSEPLHRSQRAGRRAPGKRMRPSSMCLAPSALRTERRDLQREIPLLFPRPNVSVDRFFFRSAGGDAIVPVGGGEPLASPERAIKSR